MINRIAIAGASGRMGRMLIEEIRTAPDCELTGALDVAQSPNMGSDATAFLGYASGVSITADLIVGIKGSTTLIDFTRPEGTLIEVTLDPEVITTRGTLSSITQSALDRTL